MTTTSHKPGAPDDVDLTVDDAADVPDALAMVVVRSAPAEVPGLEIVGSGITAAAIAETDAVVVDTVVEEIADDTAAPEPVAGPITEPDSAPIVEAVEQVSENEPPVDELEENAEQVEEPVESVAEPIAVPVAAELAPRKLPRLRRFAPATLVVPPAAPLKPGAIRRAPALDGLRGIAVLAVIVYHLFGDVMRGGYLGVDIFFVLSGFLITSLLVREFGATGGNSLADFWVRRARRILPASITVLVTATAVAGLIGGDVAVQLGQQFWSSLFFVNNWVQIAESQSYFADTTPRIFMHYWSLAIEEQFYVVWPLAFGLVMWLAKRLPVRRRMVVAAVLATLLAAASVAAMWLLYRPDTDPSRVYFGSDTHAFGLLAGAALALIITAPAADATDSWPRVIGERTARILGLTLAPLAFVALMVLLFTLPDTSPLTYHGGLALAALLTTVIVHNAVRENGPVARLLSLTGLGWVGARSFSLYLWHWPVFLFIEAWLGKPGSPTSPRLIGGIALAITVVLSELSYRWIETPFRRLGFRGVLRALGNGKKRALPLAVLAATFGVSMLAGSALGTSPQKSAMEIELDQLAQQQKQEQQAARAVAARKPSSGLPDGDDITALGDSVMLASSDFLRNKFPGIYIDAAVSAHYDVAEPIIASLKQQGELRDYVVLSYGTNGQAFPGQLDRMVKAIGAKRDVVLVVPYGMVDGIPQAAEQAIAFAKKRDNVYLAPWCSAAAANPGLLREDGVHPAGAGGELYADAVAKGLRQAVAGKRDPSISCPL